MIPDPRVNAGYQYQQPMVQQTQHNAYMPFDKKTDTSNSNQKAIWIAVGPNILHCLAIIFLCLLMAILTDAGGDFDEMFGGIITGIAIIVWLFTSFIVTIISTIAAFVKNSSKIWMIIGPSIGFCISIMIFVISTVMIVEDASFDDVAESLFLDINVFSMLIAGFISHAMVSSSTMVLMTLSSDD